MNCWQCGELIDELPQIEQLGMMKITKLVCPKCRGCQITTQMPRVSDLKPHTFVNVTPKIVDEHEGKSWNVLRQQYE